MPKLELWVLKFKELGANLDLKKVWPKKKEEISKYKDQRFFENQRLQQN